MAILTFNGILHDDAKATGNGYSTILVKESTGTKEEPASNFWECVGKLTDKQLEKLKKGRVVKLVCKVKTKKNETPEKTYYNKTNWILDLEFGKLYEQDQEDDPTPEE